MAAKGLWRIKQSLLKWNCFLWVTQTRLGGQTNKMILYIHKNMSLREVQVKYLAISLFTTCLMTNIYAAEQPEVLKGETARINYSVGYQISGDFRQQEIEIRPEALLRGIQDALSGSDSLMTPQEMRKTMAELGKHVAELKKKKRQELQSQ